jgi:hypothetical protein
MMLRKNPRRRAVRVAVVSASIVVGSSMLGVIASPFLPQRVAEPMCLVLPINAALAAALFRYSESITDAQPKTAHAPPHPQRAS